MAGCSSEFAQVISRMQLYKHLNEKRLMSQVNSTRTNEYLCGYVMSRIPGEKDIIMKKIKTFSLNIKKRWNGCSRTNNRFLEKHNDWLNKNLFTRSSAHQQRRLTYFNESSLSTKRRLTRNLVENNSPEKLIFAAQVSYHKHGKRRVAEEIKKAVTATPHSLKRLRLNTVKNSIKPYTPEEALALTIDAKLTFFQYKLLRKQAMERNCNIYPPYEKILQAKKDCYPEDITITETKAEVKLQSLLDHSVRRLAKVQNDTITRVISDYGTQTLVLKSKWGFDGSSNHSMYKQKFSQETDAKDADLLLTAVVPLQLVAKSGSSEVIVWQNYRPSSTRFTIPIRCQFVKETSEVIKNESEYINSQISNLVPTHLEINGNVVNIHHVLIETMLDGKTANALSNNKSSLSCYICHATPNQMNDIDAVLERPCNENTYCYGLSILHAYIRVFECVLHISYRLDIKKWRVQTCEKANLAEKKKRVIQDFRRRTGILVDVVKQGCGTSNDGNTARRFFKNPKLAAEITGVDENLITRFATILQTLSSTYKIKAESFRIYALETARLYVQLYPWYKMPASLHKLLIHGADVIDSLILPIGQLSEEALESRHKDCRYYRLHNTRKIGRKENTEDLFHILLVSSDLMISNIRPLPNRKTNCLSSEVLKLLDIPEPPNFQATSDESSSDD